MISLTNGGEGILGEEEKDEEEFVISFLARQMGGEEGSN